MLRRGLTAPNGLAAAVQLQSGCRPCDQGTRQRPCARPAWRQAQHDCGVQLGFQLSWEAHIEGHVLGLCMSSCLVQKQPHSFRF